MLYQNSRVVGIWCMITILIDSDWGGSVKVYFHKRDTKAILGKDHNYGIVVYFWKINLLKGNWL